MPAGKVLNTRIKVKKIHACCIGIDKYQNDISSLKGCVRDAKDVLDSFNPDEFDLIIDEVATRKYILLVIDKYIKKIKKNELFILTVSAHGEIVNKDLAIIPHDGEGQNLLGTSLSTMYLINALSTIAENGGKVLIILDICRAGALNFDLSKYSGALSGGGISSIYACGPNEFAKEKEFEKGKIQGVFTKYLIDGLNKESQYNHAGLITLRNLFDYVYQNVCEVMKDQHPSLIGTLEGNTILKSL